jgi:hypothetical protein
MIARNCGVNSRREYNIRPQFPRRAFLLLTVDGDDDDDDAGVADGADKFNEALSRREDIVGGQNNWWRTLDIFEDWQSLKARNGRVRPCIRGDVCALSFRLEFLRTAAERNYPG